MKKLFTILILFIVTISCDMISYVPRTYYYDYNPYPGNYYYRTYPYGYNYGFGLGWEYGPKYYSKHYFYVEPKSPNPTHTNTNRNTQTYTRPSGNVQPHTPNRQTISNSGRR